MIPRRLVRQYRQQSCIEVRVPIFSASAFNCACAFVDTRVLQTLGSLVVYARPLLLPARCESRRRPWQRMRALQKVPTENIRTGCLCAARTQRFAQLLLPLACLPLASVGEARHLPRNLNGFAALAMGHLVPGRGQAWRPVKGALYRVVRGSAKSGEIQEGVHSVAFIVKGQRNTETESYMRRSRPRA